MIGLGLIHRINVSKRLGALVLSSLLGIIAISVFFVVTEKNLILKEHQLGIQNTVEVASSLVEHYQKQVTESKMSEADAKQAALAAVKTLRFGENGYMWINDTQPKMLMHPILPVMEGQDLSDKKDSKGKSTQRETIEI